MRTPACSPVTVRTASPWPAPPRCLATKSEPKGETFTPLRLCAPECTRVRVRPHQRGHLDRAAVYRLRVAAAVPTMASTSPRRSPSSRSFPTSPSNPVESREARQGACCPGTVRPHRRRGCPVPPYPLWQNVEHLGSRLEPQGSFAHSGPHVVVAVADPSGSGAACHSSLEPRMYPHHAAPQRIPSGSRAASHADSHVGCSWV
jgi:hypothetical protein